MKAEDTYLRFTLWSDEDGCYVGFCPDLFPSGGVCHGASEETTYAELCLIVRQEVAELEAEGKPLPQAATRPMREAVPL